MFERDYMMEQAFECACVGLDALCEDPIEDHWTMTWHETLLALAERPCAVSLEINEHRLSYRSATAFVEEFDVDVLGALDDELPVYYVTVYPDTPVGFVRLAGNDLDAIARELAETFDVAPK